MSEGRSFPLLRSTVPVLVVPKVRTEADEGRLLLIHQLRIKSFQKKKERREENLVESDYPMGKRKVTSASKDNIDSKSY